MNSYAYIFGILLIGFILYFLVKDTIFGPSANQPEGTSVPSEGFSVPAEASIEIRQAPIYPPRVVASSGPNSPSQEAPPNEVVVYSEPTPEDPYYQPQDSSDIPENLRYPERSFRPPPPNNNTTIAVEAGIASNNLQVSADNSQQFRPEFIQGGGEFMPGIYANDTYNDTNYSAF